MKSELQKLLMEKEQIKRMISKLEEREEEINLKLDSFEVAEQEFVTV
jgi:hypothetical protein